jgi:DNA-binding response OmpR family regulator
LAARRQVLEPSIDGKEAAPQVIAHGGLQIDEVTKRVALFGKHVSVTPKQYALLCLLASNPGRVFSDGEILDAVWPTSSYADSKDVKQQVYLLRRRLATTWADAAKMLVNVPGFGYKLVPPVIDEDLTE